MYLTLLPISGKVSELFLVVSRLQLSKPWLVFEVAGPVLSEPSMLSTSLQEECESPPESNVSLSLSDEGLIVPTRRTQICHTPQKTKRQSISVL